MKIKTMETKFNSQICTTQEQSERLLALGLKKETADCGYYYNELKSCYEPFIKCRDFGYGDIPAWSLHRIMSMVYSSRAKKNGLRLAIIEYDNPFEDMIRQIEWLIKEGYFPQDCLV